LPGATLRLPLASESRAFGAHAAEDTNTGLGHYQNSNVQNSGYQSKYNYRTQRAAAALSIGRSTMVDTAGSFRLTYRRESILGGMLCTGSQANNWFLSL